MNTYNLDNIISILEQHKDCKTIEISQKGVIELLSYLKAFKGKDEVIKTLQDTLKATQELREELIDVIKTELIETVVNYINSYNSLVYAYIPEEPLLEFLNSLEKEETKK